jgi:hypothetical protein
MAEVELLLLDTQILARQVLDRFLQKLEQANGFALLELPVCKHW